MSYKIVIDSCGELLEQWKQDERFASVPLTLTVGSENIIDDETFNQADFLQKVAACPECPKSACPSPLFLSFLELSYEISLPVARELQKGI